MNFCKKHNIELTPSFDLSNLFCLECEKEPKNEREVIAGGFKLASPPIGDNFFTYYALSLVGWHWRRGPQYTNLFKTEDAARKEIAARVKDKLRVDFVGIEVKSLTECKTWFTSGMSKRIYAVWHNKHIPSKYDGNHAEMVREIVDATTAKKLKQAKLKPKYGGAMKPISPTPTGNTPPSPTPAPTPPQSAPTTVSPKKVTKPPLKKTPASKSPTNKPAIKKPASKKKIINNPIIKKTTTKKKSSSGLKKVVKKGTGKKSTVGNLKKPIKKRGPLKAKPGLKKKKATLGKASIPKPTKSKKAPMKKRGPLKRR